MTVTLILLEAVLLKNQLNRRLEMNKQMVYSPQDFLERLVNNDFRRPLIITGMIKKAENSDQFLFTFGTSCANWRKVPLNIIDNIEVLNFVHCNDHAHPLVKMTFKEPESEESLLFASLATDIMDEAKSPIIAHPAPRRPQISASMKSVSGNNILSITGRGFNPGERVIVQIDTVVNSQIQSSYQVPVQADNFGGITVPDQGLNCTSDHLTIYQVTATGATGSSTAAGVSC